MRAARFETQSSNKLYQKAFALFRYLCLYLHLHLYLCMAVCRQMQFELRVDIHSNEITLPDESCFSHQILWFPFEMSLKWNLALVSLTGTSHARNRFCLEIRVAGIKLPDFMELYSELQPQANHEQSKNTHEIPCFYKFDDNVALKRNWLCDSNGLVLLLTTIDN